MEGGSKEAEGKTMHDPCVHAARFPKTRRILGNRVNISDAWRRPARETYQSSEIMGERYLYINIKYVKLRKVKGKESYREYPFQ